MSFDANVGKDVFAVTGVWMVDWSYQEFDLMISSWKYNVIWCKYR